MAQRGLKNIHATLPVAGFGAPLGATVVWPQGRAICGLSPRYPWPKGSKKHSCNLAGCGIWRPLGGDFRLAPRPGGLRAASAAPWPKELKKTIMQPCRRRDLTRPWGRRSFGLKAGQVADCIRGTLGPKGSKKHSSNPAGCGIWRALGGDGRLASKPSDLRTALAVP